MVSAYFAFSEEQRPGVTEELRARAGEGEKVGVAQVAKVLGERWRALSDEEKAGYKEKAQAKADEKAAQKEAEGGDGDGDGGSGGVVAKKGKKVKRGPTAYFVFMDSARAEVQAELVAAAGEGEKVGVADVARALGEKWRALGDEEKNKYKEAAAAKAAELELEAANEGDMEGEQAEETTAANRPVLPLGTVKRIMAADDEFDRITGDGLKHVAVATELFLGLLAKKAARQAARHKRSTLKFGDVLGAARVDHRMLPVCDLLGTDSAFADARGDAPGGDPLSEVDANADGTSHKTAKARKEDTASRRITEFFRG